MAVYVNVIESDNLYKTCIISEDLANILHLIDNKNYRLRFGQCSREVKIAFSPMDKQMTIRIDSNDFFELGIPENITTGIIVNDSEIILGPVLGVFVNPRYFRRIGNPIPPGGCRNMQKANENYHLFFYFFTIKKIDWTNKKVEGWYYSKTKNSWKKSKIALPDIIYDRGVFNRKRERIADELRIKLTTMYPLRRINTGDWLDKYWLYERLRQYADLRQYLPETIRFKSIDDVSNMLKKYTTIYLKSFYGSLGSEVMAITLIPGHYYQCSYFESGKPKTSVCQDETTLSALLKTFFKDKEFVVQEGIDLLEHEQSRMDMRVLLQKDRSGMWKCVYNVAFLGRKDSLITAGEEKGAKPYNFSEIMPLVLNMTRSKINKINERICKVCLGFAKAIDKEYGSFGEIGMDMALDKNLKIWYIEANSKPDRELESNIIGDNRCRLSCMHVIEYTKYLEGFYSRAHETKK